MNVMMEPLHQTEKGLPQGLHVCPSYGAYNCGSQRTTVQLYNTKDHAIFIKKRTAVARMVAANEVPEMVVADGQSEHFEIEDEPRKVVSNSLLRREEKFCLKGWSSLWS